MANLFYDLIDTKYDTLGLVFKEDQTIVYVFLPAKENLILEHIMNKFGTIKRIGFVKRNFFVDYFDGKKVDFSKVSFDIDFLNPTNFQKQVWLSCSVIPYGKTVSYQELGLMVGTNALRALGSALGKNPLPIIIPCHRVVGKNSLGGFSAIKGISLKEKMLSLETCAKSI